MAHQTTSRTARNMLSSLGLISVLILAGCGSNSSGGDGQDGQTTTPSAETSTTTGTDEYVPASADGPAQNVPVPELPDAAREQTEEGAEATLKYWWDAMEYLYLTGGRAPLENISGDECVFCENFLEVVPETVSNGGWYVLEETISISDITVKDVNESGMIIFEYDVVQPKSQYFDAEGIPSDVRNIERSLERMETLVSYTSDDRHWIVNEVAYGDETTEPDDE